jgi:ArsR family transcriptional regulator
MKHQAQIFKALSDPIRLRIVLLLLAEGELCVCDLMAVLGLPQSTVSRHLAYLKRSCLVDTRRQGVWMHYQLSQKSCELCRELLATLTRHTATLPEAMADHQALAALQQTNSLSICP